MGHGIAQVFAYHGYGVHLVDISPSVLNRARKQIASNLSVMVEAGVAHEKEIEPTLNRIHFSESLTQSDDNLEIAIECVPEDEHEKNRVFARLSEACSPQTVIATNTSTLDIFRFATINHPERLCIAHWYAPPHIIPLVDVVKGPETSKAAIDRMVDILKALGKKPMLLRKFTPGYIVNRLQIAMAREINFLLDNDFATPKELDEAVKASLAPRMMALGLTHRMDFTGLDVSLAIQKSAARNPISEPTFRTLEKLVKAGNLGVKSGKGFYDYGDKVPEQVLRERDLSLIRIFKDVT